MAKILLVWELGGGWGHYARLDIFAPLAKAGHEVSIAARGGLPAVDFASSKLPMFTAPQMSQLTDDRIPRPLSFAQLLHNIGFGNCAALSRALEEWSQLFEAAQADIVIADHSPTALLALRGTKMKRVIVGTGFTIPKAERPFRNLRHWLTADTTQLLAFEDKLLATINRVLAQRGKQLLAHLADLYVAEQTYLQTYPELDPYGPREGAEYWGASPSPNGTCPDWPAVSGPKIFAYLLPFPGLQKLLANLRTRAASTIAVCNGISQNELSQYQSQQLRVVTEPVDIWRAAQDADLAILNGNHGTTATMLLAGTPMLQVPVSLERTLNAHHAAQLDAAVCCPPTKPEIVISTLDTMLNDVKWSNGAMAFAAKYSDFRPHDSQARMLQSIQSLV